MSINYCELGASLLQDTSRLNLKVCLFTSQGALSTSKRYLKHKPPTISFRKKSKYGRNLSLPESCFQSECRQLNKTDPKTHQKDQPRSNWLICWSAVDRRAPGLGDTQTIHSCLYAISYNPPYTSLFASVGKE